MSGVGCRVGTGARRLRGFGLQRTYTTKQIGALGEQVPGSGVNAALLSPGFPRIVLWVLRVVQKPAAEHGAFELEWPLLTK